MIATRPSAKKIDRRRKELQKNRGGFLSAINYRIIPDLKLIHFIGSGKISYLKLIEKIKQLHSEPDFHFGLNTFIDFERARVNPQDPELENYLEFFGQIQANTPLRKWAIYTRDPHTRISANRAHFLEHRGIQVDVFKLRKEA